MGAVEEQPADGAVEAVGALFCPGVGTVHLDEVLDPVVDLIVSRQRVVRFRVTDVHVLLVERRALRDGAGSSA